MDWNREEALEKQRARTRDGRDVFNLREPILEDTIVLVGDVALDRHPYKKNQTLKIESHYWGRGGLGSHGGDDLVNT